MADVNAMELAALVWMQLWQVTLVACIAAVLVRLLARNRPHLAHVLWLLVLLKCLTPPLWSSPGGVFCWLQTQSTTAGPGEGVLSAAPRLVKAGDHGASADADVVVYAPRRSAKRASIAELQDGNASSFAEQPAGAFPRDWCSGCLAGLAAIWLMGMTVVVVAGAWRWWKCWRVLRSAGRVDHPQLARMIARLVKELGLHRRVRLLVTECRVGPAVIGVLRPTVVLPLAVVQGKSPAELEPIIAHELLHIRRGDLWISLMQALAQAVWWFHPLVWLASRLITREAERCCDEQVLAELGCSPAVYARGLLDVLELKRTLWAVPTFPGVRPVEVTSKRLERIMQLGQGCRKRTPWWCWMLLAVLAAAALPGAAFQAAGEEKDAGGGKANDAHGGQRTPVESPSYAVVYKVGDLLERIEKEYRVDQERARELFSQWFGRPMQGLHQAAEQDDRVAWHKNGLVVQAAAKRHEEIVECLAQLRKYGFREIRIETTIASGSETLINELLGGWEVLPASDVNTRDSGQATVDEHGETYLLEAEIESEPQTSRPRNYGQARHTIQRQFPVTAKVLDEEQRRLVIGRLQSDARSNLITAPRVTLFNGQTAKIVDAVQRPFVVGVARSEQGDIEPQIRVITEGLSLRLNAKIKEKDKVRLDCGVDFSDILGVETMNIGRAGAEPLTVQVPEVNSMQMNTLADLESDKTLALGGLKKKRDADGKVESLLVLIRARIVPILRNEQNVKDDDAAQSAPRKAAKHDYGSRDLVVDEEQLDVLQGARKDRDDGKMTAMTYPVANLVVPVPPILSGADSDAKREIASSDIDFDSLIELIKSTVQPDAWESAGGKGTIRAFPTNLSLVVRQTRDVHDQINDLLEQLRRLQDVQITLEIEAACPPPETFGEVSRHLQLISGKQLAELREHVEQAEKDGLAGSPELTFLPAESGTGVSARSLKLTLFSGQRTELPIANGTAGSDDTMRLQVRPVVVEGRRAVRLQVTVNADDALSALANAETIVVPDGRSIVFDAREELLARRGVPAGLAHVPVVKDLLAKSHRSHGEERLLLVITPRIVVSEEEEEIPIGRRPE